MGSDEHGRQTPHEEREKNLWAEAGWTALSTFFATGIIVFSLAQFGVIAKEPFGFNIILVSLVAGALVLLFITVLAVVLAITMVKWFRWRYHRRYIPIGDDWNE